MEKEGNLPAFGIFRFNGHWKLAWGYLAGRNALDPVKECLVSDQGLRRFYTELQQVIEKGRTQSERIVLPLINPPADVSWEGLLEVYRRVKVCIEQLDSGQPIPESEAFETGGRN